MCIGVCTTDLERPAPFLCGTRHVLHRTRTFFATLFSHTRCTCANRERGYDTSLQKWWISRTTHASSQVSAHKCAMKRVVARAQRESVGGRSPSLRLRMAPSFGRAPARLACARRGSSSRVSTKSARSFATGNGPRPPKKISTTLPRNCRTDAVPSERSERGTRQERASARRVSRRAASDE
jgi:hypothetical protein